MVKGTNLVGGVIVDSFPKAGMKGGLDGSGLLNTKIQKESIY